MTDGKVVGSDIYRCDARCHGGRDTSSTVLARASFPEQANGHELVQGTISRFHICFP